jgi:hypothetical protein
MKKRSKKNIEKLMVFLQSIEQEKPKEKIERKPQFYSSKTRGGFYRERRR